MKFIVLGILIFFALLIYSSCVSASKCSRMEEIQDYIKKDE